MSKYQDYLNEVAKAIEEKKGDKTSKATMFSRSALIDFTAECINDPDYSITLYAGGDKGITEVVKQPGKEHREQVKKVVKNVYGIDDAEASKLDTAKFSKKYAEALVDLNLITTKNYLDAGKKITLPLTSTAETRATISTVQRDEKETIGRKLVKGEDGKSENVFTGKTTITKPQKAIRVSNKTLPWNKEVK